MQLWTLIIVANATPSIFYLCFSGLMVEPPSYVLQTKGMDEAKKILGKLRIGDDVSTDT